MKPAYLCIYLFNKDVLTQVLIFKAEQKFVQNDDIVVRVFECRPFYPVKKNSPK